MGKTTAPVLHRSADTPRCIAVVVAAVVAVVGSFVGSGAVVGTPVSETSGGALSSDATLVAPAGPAFSIWTVIYIGFVAYAVWQALPAERSDPRQRRAGWAIALSMILNAAWILVVQLDLIWLSVAVIVALLITLIVVFRLLLSAPPRSVAEAVVVDGTMFLYLGWVCVAVAANVSAALVSAGYDTLGLGATAWAIIVLAVVGVVAVVLAVVGRGRVAVAAAVVWGLCWVAYARTDDTTSQQSTEVAVTALVVAIVTVVAAVVSRLARASGPGSR